MNKDKILEKSRRDNVYLDERQESELGNGFSFGGIAVAIFCVIFSIIKALQQEHFYEFGVIIFGYMSATSLYCYSKAKKKHFLIQGIAGIISVLGGFAGYLFL